MPFITDKLNSFNPDRRSAGMPDTARPLVNSAKTRLSNSRFVFDPESVMEKLRQRIVGQDQVLENIFAILKVLKADIADSQRPLYVGLFVGATGVGKTELVRVLAEAIHGQADAFCRIDMNTLAQDHYAAAITGAPPGYVGSKEGNSLIDVEKVQGSYSRPGIVLLDEIEKAGTEVIRAFLNVIETGQLRLTSGAKTIDFRNSLIFMTSNSGAKNIQDYEQRFTQGWRRFIPCWLLPSLASRRKTIRGFVDAAMQQKFDPEFINRLDQILLFNRIEKHGLRTLVEIEIEKLNRRLSFRGWQVGVTPAACQWLTKFYDPRFGARSIRRAFKQNLELALANFLLQPDEGEPSKDLRLSNVDLVAGQLTVEESMRR